MSTTKAEAKRQTLELLGVVSIGQSFQTQDDVAMDEAYAQVFEDLKTLGLATWASAGPVPDDVVPHLIALMAFNKIDTYGVSDSRYQRIGVRVAGAKREIRLLVTPPYESLEEPDDY